MTDSDVEIIHANGIRSHLFPQPEPYAEPDPVHDQDEQAISRSPQPAR